MRLSALPRRWLPLCTCLFLALSLDHGLAQAQFAPRLGDATLAGGPADVARVIVKFRAESTLTRKHPLQAAASLGEVRRIATARADALSARLGLALHSGRALSEQAQVIHARGISSAALAAYLGAEADVEYAVVDQRRTHLALPNDPLYLQGPAISGSSGGPDAGQWYLRAPTTALASSIDLPGAWDQTIGSAGIVVAVIDTGIRPEHPDLAGRLLAGYDFVSNMFRANDSDGRDADATDPGDWVTTAEAGDAAGPFYQCSTRNSSWHGTQTASLIGAATNNGVGMAGVAPGVWLLPVRALGKCGGYDSDIIAAMKWAAGLAVPGTPTNLNPARVINLSLGASGSCLQSYVDAIGSIGNQPLPAVIVVAAGNSSGHNVNSPANCPGVIAVAGLRHIGTKVGFSDLGPEISISAPGGNCVNTATGSPCLYPILAATNSGTTTAADSTYSDSFNAGVGTSFSAPLVAGTVALMLSVQASLTPTQVKAALQRSARPFPATGADAAVQACHPPTGSDQLECYCTTALCGAGMLDASASVAAVLPAASTLALSVSKLGTGTGTVSSTPPAIDCGPSCSAAVATGSSVTLNASAGNGSVFSGWGGDCAGLNSCVLSMAQARSATANFASRVLALSPGWNLAGNGVEAPITVADNFSDPNKVLAVWKWVAAGTTPGISYPTWAYCTPAQSDLGRGFAASKGYEFLTSIAAGEGFWLNAKASFAFTLPSAPAVASSSFVPAPSAPAAAGGTRALAHGWRMIATGDSASPAQFDAAIATVPSTTPGAGQVQNNLTALWAWDAAQQRWYFWAPALVNSGGLAAYLSSKAYLDFANLSNTPVGTLAPTRGLWINMP